MTALPRPDDVAALVLCGGRGARMGGVDKPLLRWRGRPMVAHVAHALAPLAATLWIAANRSHAGYRAALQDWPGALHLRADRAAGFAGPRAGLDAVLDAVGAAWLLVSAGDTPQVDTALFARLLAVAATGSGVAVAHDGHGIAPLHVAIHLAARRGTLPPTAVATVADDGRAGATGADPLDDGSMKGWLKRAGAIAVDCRDPVDGLRSFDRPADLDGDPG